MALIPIAELLIFDLIVVILLLKFEVLLVHGAVGFYWFYGLVILFYVFLIDYDPN